MKKDTTKVKSKQLTEKRVREIAREEVQKVLSEHCKEQAEMLRDVILERMEFPEPSNTLDKHK